jgi:hypothetical protein
MGLNAKTYLLTDRQSQCDFDFELSQFCTEIHEERTWVHEAEVSPLLKSITRKHLVKTLQAGDDCDFCIVEISDGECN